MKRASNLWRIALALSSFVASAHRAEWPVWDEHLVPIPRGHPYRNPRRNRERWVRRLARWERRRARVTRRERVRLMRTWSSAALAGQVGLPQTQNRLPTMQPTSAWLPQMVESTPPTPATPVVLPDPLADLRKMRGWIDQMDERELWAMLIRVRWPQGLECPRCGERDSCHLKLLEPDYRGGLGRWRCLVCALAGDQDDQSTFTPLTGTILEGAHLDIRTIWLIVECFADGKASVETADEARVHRHSTDRLFRLLRAAIYQSPSSRSTTSASATRFTSPPG